MSHQPFEAWLFDEPSLDGAEAEALRQHLAECGACRSLAEAWDELGGLLRSPGLAAPTAGFAGRWRARLAFDRERRRRRQAWWALGLTAGGGLGLTVALGIQIAALLRSPAMLALRFAQSFSAFLAQLFLLREAIASLAEDLPPLLTSGWVLAFLGILALLGGVWAFSIYRYAFQGVRK
jgi:hypothetical protein